MKATTEALPAFRSLICAMVVQASLRNDCRVLGKGITALRHRSLWRTATVDDINAARDRMLQIRQMTPADVTDKNVRDDVELLLETAMIRHLLSHRSLVWESIGVRPHTGAGMVRRKPRPITFPIFFTLAAFALGDHPVPIGGEPQHAPE